MMLLWGDTFAVVCNKVAYAGIVDDNPCQLRIVFVGGAVHILQSDTPEGAKAVLDKLITALREAT